MNPGVEREGKERLSRLFVEVEPDALIEQVKAKYAPIRSYCLFSGGNDSLVTAHRCLEHYDELVFIDTGTAIPGVRDFVEEAATWLEKPLRVYETPPDVYDRIVLGGVHPKSGKLKQPLGFPGPMQHTRCYIDLKERQLDALLRDTKDGDRKATVLAITGLRRSESARRRGRKPITKRGSLIFCNPLSDWTDEDVRAYHREHDLPTSDVVALLHRSGECNCGAYATPDERHDLQALFPEWFDQRIGSLEREAERMGLPSAKWGYGRDQLDLADDEAGELCSDCQLRFESVP